jgi:tellurite resistance protein TehA-like permease
MFSAGDAIGGTVPFPLAVQESCTLNNPLSRLQPDLLFYGTAVSVYLGCSTFAFCALICVFMLFGLHCLVHQRFWMHWLHRKPFRMQKTTGFALFVLCVSTAPLRVKSQVRSLRVLIASCTIARFGFC